MNVVEARDQRVSQIVHSCVQGESQDIQSPGGVSAQISSHTLANKQAELC